MANILPWKQTDPIQKYRDRALDNYYRVQQEGLESYQRIQIGFGLADYTLSQFLPRYQRVQQVSQTYPELEGVLSSFSVRCLDAGLRRAERFINAGQSPLQTDDLPTWLRL